MDTRNNMVELMFVTKYRYNCFLKQSHIDTCRESILRCEKFGYKFGVLEFGGNHLHLQADIPKGYSIETAEIMLKSISSKAMFEEHPGFRKRYPNGSFWSGYEHHQSIGIKSLEASTDYILGQQEHHNIRVVDDRQQKLTFFAAS